MATNTDEPHGDDDTWLHGSPTHRLALRLGLANPTRPRRALRILLLVVVTWVPLVLFSLAAGTALGGRVALPLLRDPEIYIRFLFVVPLLELAEYIVSKSINVQVRHLVASGLVPERERAVFDSARNEVARLRRSVLAEGTMIVLSLALPIVMRVFIGFDVRPSSWERIGEAITSAGWWYILVSLPVLFFFLFRWCWVFLLWSRFLFQVSRLDLELTPTHPDRAGGLGFIGWGLASFATIGMAVSAVISGALAQEISQRGSSLNDLKYHLIVFGVAAVLIQHAPLFAFSGRLARCRFAALLDFGTLVWRHDRAFDEKWIKAADTKESLLGSPDVQSLADVATAYEHVERMRLVPFDEKALAVSVVAVLVPIVPLVATQLPLAEIFGKLAELML
jgi:hypothetical protein